MMKVKRQKATQFIFQQENDSVSHSKNIKCRQHYVQLMLLSLVSLV
jgi:hypothetical protein